MPKKRITLSLTLAQLKAVEALGEKHQLDVTNALRYCIAQVCENEGIKIQK